MEKILMFIGLVWVIFAAVIIIYSVYDEYESRRISKEFKRIYNNFEPYWSKNGLDYITYREFLSDEFIRENEFKSVKYDINIGMGITTQIWSKELRSEEDGYMNLLQSYIYDEDIQKKIHQEKIKGVIVPT